MSFKSLKVVDNFYQNNLFFPMPTVGISSLCMVYILKNGGGEPGLIKYYETLYGAQARNEVSAKRIYELSKTNIPVLKSSTPSTKMLVLQAVKVLDAPDRIHTDRTLKVQVADAELNPVVVAVKY